ncbi:Cyclopropane fatty-acyl-phospholipid synthase [Jatrophihabitans endophyticus]|uniref:Cyclopropane fatty-acyl-phospholipid synthase n=2 Tax=Jatrophihabitans endophyticus TaxID=1206085 RepID=A0A1M5BVN7_9ACTN|nr:DUF1365 family protein [Jatrophihabitans endophyticus]SHF46614.1 Cyclopropane fatty-acyl-phospholipid synthase [Jatrophihabitans endophyticus]
MKPALYDVSIAHVRAEPVRHEVRHSSYLWFVDVDELPRHGSLARFEARDHAGDPARSIRANVEEFLAERGIDLVGGRITMLTNARSLGYVFNPLTLYWCHEPDGTLAAVVAEVHNTYAQRHRYLLRPDDAGRAETQKEFYVSPFYPVDGSYRMSLPEPGERLAVTITLHRPGGRPFTASVRGVRRPATRAAVLATALRHPFETWLVRALITAHGIRLWRKGLPVQPRPSHPSDPRPSEVAMPSTPTVADRLAALLRDTAGFELPVRIRAWDGSEAGPADGPVLVIRSRRALRRLLWAPGELGLARAYVTGDLDVEGDTDDLADGFRRAWRLARTRPSTGVDLSLGAKAKAAGAAARLGALGTPPAPPVSEARLRGRLHSRLRDRAAISHHYDLSNEFYELLLDEHMAYSSAYFTHEGQSLHDAQTAKLDLVCRKLGLQPGMRLLDVGCGWGSMILHAAEHYGVSCVGITLSGEQRDFITKRIAERGLADRVEVRLQDYREFGDTGETFHAVSSIEMGEHVGEGNYPEYVGIMYGALEPGGRVLLQQMSRQEGTAPGGGAFIESYIAPDMHMREIWQTTRHLVKGGFEVRDVEAMREHYVTTVQHWIDTFDSRWDEFVALQGEEVARVWRLYLVGGMLAFEEGRMGVDQFLAVKPAAAGASGMPATRPWAVES